MYPSPHSVLVRNTSLIDRIPGGLTTIDIMRWILIGSTVIYIVPIFTYLILFRKSHVLWEIVMGAFSFIFYGPTYLNILNIYSLCRIDDISWGTKGLDSGAGGGKNAGLKDSWRLIKFIHVSKYVIWNIVLSVTLLSLGSSYQARFFITIIMVVMMAGTLSLKIVIGIIYMITYKISDARCCKDQKIPKITPGESRIKKIVDSYREEIEMEIRNYLNDAAEEYKKNDFQKFGGSFVQATRTKRNIDKSLKKHSEQAFNRSKIEKPKNKAYHANHALLPSITE
jgi:magnesium-transporting ATPase (P-type)